MKLFYLILFITCTITASAQRKLGVGIIMQEQVKTVKFFPNPAVSVINFEFKQIDKGVTLQIYNFLGKKVKEVVALSEKTVIPLQDFYRGVYIFQLRDKTGKIIESGKFQVNK